MLEPVVNSVKSVPTSYKISIQLSGSGKNQVISYRGDMYLTHIKV